jgi:protein SCO1/2
MSCRRIVMGSLLLLTAGAAAHAQPPLGLEEIGIEQHLNRLLPEALTFVDDTGKEVRLGDYLGDKPLVLALVYYECPMLCTLVLNGMVSSLDVLTFDVGQEYDVVAVSIDPGETPELAAAKKAAYVERYGRPGTEDGWHFLTGDEKSIQTLANAVGFSYRYDPETDQYAHAAGIMVVTSEGRLARYFYGVEYSPKDLRFALVEASEGRIGTFVDQVVLYCYRYDPSTGTYTAVINRILKLAGGVTLVGLLGFIVGARVVERRLRRRAA